MVLAWKAAADCVWHGRSTVFQGISLLDQQTIGVCQKATNLARVVQIDQVLVLPQLLGESPPQLGARAEAAEDDRHEPLRQVWDE